jgi:putative transposase
MGVQRMLDRVVENAREEEVFSREDTPTEQRVEAAFLYHAGLSYHVFGMWIATNH